jgi:hypothetical protein
LGRGCLGRLGGLVVGLAALGGALTPGHYRGVLLHRIGNMGLDLLDRFMSINGPITAPGSKPSANSSQDIMSQPVRGLRQPVVVRPQGLAAVVLSAGKMESVRCPQAEMRT